MSAAAGAADSRTASATSGGEHRSVPAEPAPTRRRQAGGKRRTAPRRAAQVSRPIRPTPRLPNKSRGYKTAETLYAQQEAVDQQINDLEARQLDVQKQLQSLTAESEPGTPISFIEFDRLVNELAAEKSRIELVARESEGGQGGARSGAKRSRRPRKGTPPSARRRPTSACGPRRREACRRRRTGQARQRAGGRHRHASPKGARREKLTEDRAEASPSSYLDKKVTRFRPLVVFAESDLQDQLKKLTAQEEALRAVAPQAPSRICPIVQSKWTAAKWRHDAATGDRGILAEELEASRRDKEKTQDEINVYLAQLLQLDQLRTAWNRLYQLLAAAPQPTAEELADWDSGNVGRARKP